MPVFGFPQYSAKFGAWYWEATKRQPDERERKDDAENADGAGFCACSLHYWLISAVTAVCAWVSACVEFAALVKTLTIAWFRMLSVCAASASYHDSCRECLRCENGKVWIRKIPRYVRAERGRRADRCLIEFPVTGKRRQIEDETPCGRRLPRFRRGKTIILWIIHCNRGAAGCGIGAMPIFR